MAEVNLSGTVRNQFGKGAARRLRREEKIPAVIYGHGEDPVHVELPSYDMMMALKTPNVLLNLDIDGKRHLVIPKAVQREAIRQFLIHVDLLTVKKGEKVNVEIPVHTEGDLGPGQHLVELNYHGLPVEAEATHIPEAVTISVEGMVTGDTVLAKDVKLPRGTSLDIDPEDIVVQILSAQAEEAEEGAEEAEGEGGSSAE